MAEQIRLIALPFMVETVATVARPAAGLTWLRDWQVPPAKPKRRTAPGRLGAQALGPADYEDRTWTLEIERIGAPGDDATDSEAWLQAWQAVAGLANEMGGAGPGEAIRANATLERTTATGATVSYRVLDMTVESDAARGGGTLWRRGKARAKVTVTTQAAGVAPEITLPGTLTISSSGAEVGRPRWTSTDQVPGDLPPIATITATFSEKRRQVTAQLGTGGGVMHTAATWTALAGAETVSAPAGAVAANVLRKVIVSPDLTQLPLLRVSPVDTYYTAEIDARVSLVGDPEPADLVLLDNGREIARRSVVPLPSGSGSRPWQIVPFGRHRISGPSSGGVLTLVAEVRGVVEVLVDYVSAQSVLGSARLRTAPLASGETAAGALPPDDTSTLNGSAGELGGTWASTAWQRTLVGDDGYYASTGAGAARLGAVSLPASVVARVASDNGRDFAVSLKRSTGSGEIAFAPDPSGDAASVSVTSQDGITSLIPVPWEVTPNAYVDVELLLDDAGRWAVLAAPAGRPLRRLASGTASGTWSGAWLGGVVSAGSTPVRARSVLLKRVSDGATQITWSTSDQSPAALAVGDLPRLWPGSYAQLILRAGGDHDDALPGHAPSALTVKVQPIYFDGPG